MRLVRDGAEVGVHERNEVVDEHLLERAEVEAAAGAAASARTRRGVRRACAGWGRVGSPQSAAERVASELHRDDEGLRFALGQQVVHDEAGAALAAPAGFILARAVLE